MADDQSDRVKPWTIKGIPPEARNAAIAAADREKQNLGEWMSRAILSQIQSDRQRSRAPTVVGLVVNHEVDLANIERVVTMTAQLAAAGAPPPKGISRATYGLLRDALGRMKQISPTGTRKGPTAVTESPTDVTDGPTETEVSPTSPAKGPTLVA